MPRQVTPIDVPVHLWADPRMEAALDRNDIGMVLRLVAGHTGYSQHRLAGAINVPQGRISEYIAGRRCPNLATVAHIADGLAMPEHARQRLGLAGTAAPNADGPTRMSTRRLLRTAEQLGHGNTLWRPSADHDGDSDADAWLRFDRILRGRNHVDQATIARLDARTRGLWQLSDQIPARTVSHAIIIHANHITGLLRGTMPDGLRTRLVVAVGQTAGIAACCAADLGDQEAVNAQLRTAQTAAHESDDPKLASLVLEFHSQAQARQGRHQQALDTITTAEDRARHASPAIVTYFRLRRAEEETFINGHPETNTLAQATAEPPAIDGDDGWTRLWARPVCLEAVQADILAHNAAHDDAAQHADHADAELTPPRSKSDAVAVTNLAATYSLLGDTQRSCRAARAALTTARETEATGCLDRLESIATTLTRATHDAEAKALRHDIITAQQHIRAAENRSR